MHWRKDKHSTDKHYERELLPISYDCLQNI